MELRIATYTFSGDDERFSREVLLLHGLVSSEASLTDSAEDGGAPPLLGPAPVWSVKRSEVRRKVVDEELLG